MSPQRHILLGLLFLTAFSILGYYTLFRADFNPFTEQHRLEVYFEDAGGLREGDAILVAGMRWGKVESLVYDAAENDPERRILARLVLTQRVTLYTDHAITIEDASVLGGKFLRIEPGFPSAGVTPAGDLYGSVPGSALASIGSLIEENRESIQSTMADLSILMSDAKAGKGVLGALFTDETLRSDLTGAVSSVRSAFENIDTLAETIRTGDGTISSLINDDAIYKQFKSLGDSLTVLSNDVGDVIKDVKSGKGVIGSLINDTAMAERVRLAIDDVSITASRLRKGEGTIGRLLTDSTVADNLKAITVAIADGPGTLHSLVYESALYDQAVAILDDVDGFTAGLGNKDGTMYKLFNDDEAYTELMRALRTLTGTLEEAREAAPISAFLSLGFQGF
ncbi:MAG: phospholipid/cholesterol/gamma-HCH transport system substrate-binding protein [Glaciecola sp.]|jgi:phospholipid/cholesterol/gamma-HCH transport system substrate-binding protein